MHDKAQNRPVLVIPCSGMGKVHGLISREATYIAADELAPGIIDTICLSLLVKGDAEAIAAVKAQACITIDGCPKACAEKNVELAGGHPAKALQVAEAYKSYRGAKPGTPTELTDDGWAIARDVAVMAVNEAARLNVAGEEK